MILPDKDDPKKIQRTLTLQLLRWSFFEFPIVCIVVWVLVKALLHADCMPLLAALIAANTTGTGVVASWYFHGANKDQAE